MSTPDELRKEYLALKHGGELEMMLGSTCCNCGSQENIEYHHIVPLILGGTNRWTNITPLCSRCHKAAHRGRHISHYTSHANSGRPTKCTDDEAFDALDKWADGQIGMRKLRELMRLKEPKSGGSAINRSAQYKKWMRLRGYKRVKNTLDVTASNRSYGINGGTYIGTITMTDGYDIDIYFNDTGLNDDVMYKVRGTNELKSFREIKIGIATTDGSDSESESRFA